MSGGGMSMWGLVTGGINRNHVRLRACKEGKYANRYSWLFARMDLILISLMDGWERGRLV